MIKLPQNLAAVNWQFREGFESVSLKFTILNGFNTKKGLYFQCYDGFINGVGMYWGLQTNLHRPGRGFMGNGVIFSRWGTADPNEARIPESGFLENSAHEGQFIGVRKPVNLFPGKYTIRLAKTSSESDGDWYTLLLQFAQEPPTDCGSLFFPITEKKGFTDGCGTWMELYWTGEQGLTLNEDEIPTITILLESILADENISPKSADLQYPYAGLPNFSDVSRVGDGIKWEIGPGVTRVTAAGRLFNLIT